MEIVNNFLGSKPLFVTLAAWLGLIFVVLVIILLAYIAYLRSQLRLAQLLSRRVQERWQPVFRKLRQNHSAELPAIGRRDMPYLLELWVKEKELASKQYSASLVSLAFQVGLDHEIARLLKSHDMTLIPRKIWQQALAITAARSLDTEVTRKSLLLMVQTQNYYLASKACAALVALRASGWEQETIKTLFRFPLHAPYIVAQLSDSGGAELFHIIAPYIDLLPSYTERNFASLTERASDPALLPMLMDRLQKSDSDEEKAAILRGIRRIGGPQQRSQVLPFLDSTSMILRLQAIKTIGTIGEPADRELLVHHLSDPEWWVRYRAARAYIQLSGNDRLAIPAFIDSLTDRYSRDIMRHALAEMEWCMT